MDSYVVRVYRRTTARSGVVGLVEDVQKRERRGFTSFEELWAILTDRRPSSARRTRRSGEAGGPTRGKKETDNEVTGGKGQLDKSGNISQGDS